MVGKVASGLAAIVWASSLLVAAERAPEAPQAQATSPHAGITPAALFEPGDTCMVCHNNLVTRTGEDVSIGVDWRASMMANSARDPYWQAAVRRETMDHPAARETIEDECSICHMPMTTYPARAAGGKGRIFDHLPLGRPDDADAALASDGVSCSVCHQIRPEKFGEPSSFTGGYVIDVTAAPGSRAVFGPFAVDAGRTRVMQSSSGFAPNQSAHVQQSELCATCHTLTTHSLATGANGATLPEQMPYQEWRHSEYRETRSCQSCHMPVIEEEIPLAQILGQPRAGVSRHTFLGGNFFMMRVLNRYRAELGVRATPTEMSSAITRTERHLREDTARVSIASAQRSGQQLQIDVDVENLAGHKFPTAYPSRRAWIQLTVKDAQGRAVFESGAWTKDGRITGNANDADPSQFEPHYAQISSADEVQIYESVMGDPAGRLTTGLLTASQYLKDNRLLPRGFDKRTASADVAIHGSASGDANFEGGRDRVRYVVNAGAASGELTVTATLWFQPIGFRWADNLRGYDAAETRRFVRYYESMSGESALAVSTTSTSIR